MGTRLTLPDWMYRQIPPATRYRDEVESGAALQQLIDVLAVGVEWAQEKVDGFVYLIDPETCPEEVLPLLGAFLGFEFPFDLPVPMQRAFILNAVALGRIKGTPATLQLVVNRLMGPAGFVAEVMDEDWRAKTFSVQVATHEEGNAFPDLERKVFYLVGQYKPAGMIPTIIFLYYSTEVLHVANVAEQGEAWELADGYVFNAARSTFNSTAKFNHFDTITPLDI
jgi:phage tail-like protein